MGSTLLALALPMSFIPPAFSAESKDCGGGYRALAHQQRLKRVMRTLNLDQLTPEQGRAIAAARELKQEARFLGSPEAKMARFDEEYQVLQRGGFTPYEAEDLLKSGIIDDDVRYYAPLNEPRPGVAGAERERSPAWTNVQDHLVYTCEPAESKTVQCSALLSFKSTGDFRLTPEAGQKADQEIGNFIKDLRARPPTPSFNYEQFFFQQDALISNLGEDGKFAVGEGSGARASEFLDAHSAGTISRENGIVIEGRERIRKFLHEWDGRARNLQQVTDKASFNAKNPGYILIRAPATLGAMVPGATAGAVGVFGFGGIVSGYVMEGSTLMLAGLSTGLAEMAGAVWMFEPRVLSEATALAKATTKIGYAMLDLRVGDSVYLGTHFDFDVGKLPKAYAAITDPCNNELGKGVCQALKTHVLDAEMSETELLARTAHDVSVKTRPPAVALPALAFDPQKKQRIFLDMLFSVEAGPNGEKVPRLSLVLRR